MASPNIWDGRHHPLVTRPPLSDEMIQQWEKKYGLVLPPGLIAALKLQNGGSLKPRRFKFGKRIIEIDEIAGVAPDEVFCCMAPLSQWSTEECEGVFRDIHGDPDKLVPLTGDGHYYFCLDYNGAPSTGPSVCLIEMEGDPTKERICDSFDELLAHAYPGDPQPSFQFGALPAGFHVIAELRVSAKRKKQKVDRQEHSIVAVSDQNLLIEKWEPTCFGLRLQRTQCAVGTIRKVRSIEADRMNGRWYPEVYEWIVSCQPGLTLVAMQEESVWINQEQDSWNVTLADTERKKLEELQRTLLSLADRK